MNENKEQPISPPDPVEVAECAICHGEIYRNEEYYLMDDGRIVCPDCLGEWAADFGTLMVNNLEEIA